MSSVRVDNLKVASQSNEKNVALPDGWCWASLKNLVKTPKSDIVDGPFGSSLKASEYVDKGIPIVRIQNVDRNRFVDKNIRFISHQKAVELKRHNFHPRDILITKLGDPLGRACIVPDGFGPGIIVADIVRLHLNNQFCSIPYLVHAINSGPVIEQFFEHIKGTTRPRVNLGHIRSLKIPLAPLAEQKRIVAKVEQLLAQVNAARKRLAKLPEILKRFRQSVLAAACSGRLTADWREANPNFEPAKVLLDTILRNKKTGWKSTQAVDVKTKKQIKTGMQRRNKFKEWHTAPNFDICELPNLWTWASLSDVTEHIGDVDHKMPKARRSGIPYISTRDFVGHDEIDYDNAKRISGDDYLTLCRKIKPEKGDLLLSRYGTVGELRKVHTDQPFQASYSIAIIKSLKDIDIAGYLFLAIRSQVVQGQIYQCIRASAQPDLGLAHIRRFAIPLPPLLEQHQIRRRVKALFKLADRIEKRVAGATEQAQKLTQAILAKAFRGELVPTEAELSRRESRDYEPASVLVERIKAERAALEKEKRPKKRVEARRRRHRIAAKESAAESKSPASADTSESPKRVSTDSDSKSHMTAVPHACHKWTPVNQEKTYLAAKKSKPRISQRPVALSDLETEEVMAAFRKACRGRGAMTREELLKEVSSLLSYQHLGSAIQERLKGHLRAAIRRKIIGTNGNELWLETPTMDDYDRADLVGFLSSVMRWDKEYDREEVIRALANYLGFRRLTEGVQGPIRSAINSAIREGNIVATGPTIRRIL